MAGFRRCLGRHLRQRASRIRMPTDGGEADDISLTTASKLGVDLIETRRGFGYIVEEDAP